MGTIAVNALRVVIVIALAGSLAVQCVITPLIWQDLEGAPPSVRVPFVVIIVLGSRACRGPLSAFGGC